MAELPVKVLRDVDKNAKVYAKKLAPAPLPSSRKGLRRLFKWTIWGILSSAIGNAIIFSVVNTILLGKFNASLGSFKVLKLLFAKLLGTKWVKDANMPDYLKVDMSNWWSGWWNGKLPDYIPEWLVTIGNKALDQVLDQYLQSASKGFVTLERIYLIAVWAITAATAAVFNLALVQHQAKDEFEVFQLTAAEIPETVTAQSPKMKSPGPAIKKDKAPKPAIKKEPAVKREKAPRPAKVPKPTVKKEKGKKKKE